MFADSFLEKIHESLFLETEICGSLYLKNGVWKKVMCKSYS